MTRPILPIPTRHPKHDPNSSVIAIPKFSNQVPIKSSPSYLGPDSLAHPSTSNPNVVKPCSIYPGPAVPSLPLGGIKRKSSQVLTINPKRINITQAGPSTLTQPGPSNITQAGPSSLAQPRPASLTQAGTSNLGPFILSPPSPFSLDQPRPSSSGLPQPSSSNPDPKGKAPDYNPAYIPNPRFNSPVNNPGLGLNNPNPVSPGSNNPGPVIPGLINPYPVSPGSINPDPVRPKAQIGDKPEPSNTNSCGAGNQGPYYSTNFSAYIGIVTCLFIILYFGPDILSTITGN